MKKEYKIVSFYCFISLNKDYIEEIKDKLLEFATHDLTGLIILGQEGINGTVCGKEDSTNIFIKLIKKLLDSHDLNIKESYSFKRSFEID